MWSRKNDTTTAVYLFCLYKAPCDRCPKVLKKYYTHGIRKKCVLQSRDKKRKSHLKIFLNIWFYHSIVTHIIMFVMDFLLRKYISSNSVLFLIYLLLINFNLTTYYFQHQINLNFKEIINKFNIIINIKYDIQKNCVVKIFVGFCSLLR